MPQIRTIKLNRIDFSCDAPPRMLDIHEDLSGDISLEFEPYSHEKSVDHFFQFFQAWNMDVSRDGAESLVQHLEAFSCGEGQDAPLQALPAHSDMLQCVSFPSTIDRSAFIRYNSVA